jgi:lipopolysaccharide heptosyltransferase II
MSSKRILVINPHGIGDVLFTTPLLANLRRAYPNAHIAYIGNRRTVDFLKDNPTINQVFCYERDEFYAVFKKNVFGFMKKWFDFASQIKQQRFDIVFDFSLNSAFGFLCFWAVIPERYGFDYKGRGRFLTRKFALRGFEGRHVVEHYLDLLNAINVPVIDRDMEFTINPKDQQWADEWLKEQGLSNNSILVGIVPGGGASWGTSASKKRWPAEKYAGLVDKIIAEKSAAVILMGDVKEQDLCTEITRLSNHQVYSAAGNTTLGQMAALFKKCRLVIVNDGGPLHVAVATKTSSVSIFGPVDPNVYGPFPLSHHLVIQKGLACQPCYRRFRMAPCSHLSCLQDLSVEDVFRKVEQVI